MSACLWEQDYYASNEGRWDTQCGESFYLENGTPADNKMKYCPYCGYKLFFREYSADEEEK